ncbi:hypothetical protein CEP48_01360 [Mergibacter septicus]|uniref:UPF0270 protein CEP48_01360 n=1 Tax=Mergibacter septicus TaxID=221402 RepID=A0A8E3SCM2_9PAST|nr:YheU family protein [Mergibacter septicus]AWX14423.1 hypothetical protein CEP49_07720 [Mergibacter septicus]AWX14899.1 hypothetical protein CEP47_01360 [Mergibacter septicus]QDJ14151.1 hypothetical protein CEP48_01360 [Mergibacter septicus]UTU48400.1 YheU family protein [Mergibacter septicus]WMR95972.1 YheU family protein [Mergibacter septicus]
MIIPWQHLEPETLKNIIQSFILREGTDYGLYELSLAEKEQRLQQQIERGDVLLVWSELHQSIDLKPKAFFVTNK